MNHNVCPKRDGMDAVHSRVKMQSLATKRLVELGWSSCEGGAACASKVYQTAVGPKQALVFLKDFGRDSVSFMLSGEYYSEGRNVLEPRSVLIPKIADEQTVSMHVDAFATQADEAVSQSYAARLLFRADGSQRGATPAPSRRCPAVARFPGDIVGCGSDNVTEPDDEGLCDCLNCGLFFRADEDQGS